MIANSIMKSYKAIAINFFQRGDDMDEYKIELSPSMMIFEREAVVELIAAKSAFCFRK